MDRKNELKIYFDNLASERKMWKKRNRFYHKTLEKYYRFFIPENSNVLEIGSGTGELLAAVNPSSGLGIDFSEQMISVARQAYPDLKFICNDAENLSIDEKFD